MAMCNHEPWMRELPAGSGEPRPWDVSGFLKPPALICRHCGAVYVERATMEAFDRSQERANRGEVPTLGSLLAGGRRKGEN